jgi:hypothetical protein
VLDISCKLLSTTREVSGRCVNKLTLMRVIWVKTKRIKIGVRISTDSFTPLRFRMINIKRIKNANKSLKECKEAGRKLKMASAPLDMDIVMVST